MIVIETCPVCGSDIQDVNLCTYPPIPAKQCPKCGWKWQGKQEEIVRVPFDPKKYEESLNSVSFNIFK